MTEGEIYCIYCIPPICYMYDNERGHNRSLMLLIDEISGGSIIEKIFQEKSFFVYGLWQSRFRIPQRVPLTCLLV